MFLCNNSRTFGGRFFGSNPPANRYATRNPTVLGRTSAGREKIGIKKTLAGGLKRIPDRCGLRDRVGLKQQTFALFAVKKMTNYNDTLSQYITDLFAKQDDAQRRALEDSPKHGLPAISVKPEEGKFLQVLVSSCNAVKAVEIGTLGGYSGIWIARGLAPGGKLITLEREQKHADVARAHFAAAGVADRVEIRIGDAHESLKSLTAESPFDFVFIDAEKSGYPFYFDWALANVRVGGVIAAHNAFRNGSVAGVGAPDEDTEAMRAFNRRVANEPRVLSTIYPAGDGTVVAVKVS